MSPRFRAKWKRTMEENDGVLNLNNYVYVNCVSVPEKLKHLKPHYVRIGVFCYCIQPICIVFYAFECGIFSGLLLGFRSLFLFLSSYNVFLVFSVASAMMSIQ